MGILGPFARATGSATRIRATGIGPRPIPIALAGYEIIEEMGRGGMGVVFKARHVRMNRLVALKVINKEHLISPRTIQRFYREIQAAAQLSHPNIVMAFDAGQSGDTHYFAMEYVEGVDLNRLVQQTRPAAHQVRLHFRVPGRPRLAARQRRDLVHRDVKPSNLFVTWSSPANASALRQASLPPLERATVKILDLGLALLTKLPKLPRPPAA